MISTLWVSIYTGTYPILYVFFDIYFIIRKNLYAPDIKFTKHEQLYRKYTH